VTVLLGKKRQEIKEKAKASWEMRLVSRYRQAAMSVRAINRKTESVPTLHISYDFGMDGSRRADRREMPHKGSSAGHGRAVTLATRHGKNVRVIHKCLKCHIVVAFRLHCSKHLLLKCERSHEIGPVSTTGQLLFRIHLSVKLS
jgi:hypothetical protein